MNKNSVVCEYINNKMEFREYNNLLVYNLFYLIY